jgi:signal transduction histidine kinase
VATLFQRDGECEEVSLALALPGGPVPVRADSDRLRQALWNLLQNARRAVSPGGHITVRLGTEGSTAILEVEDDGVGMRQDEVRAFFQPFRHGFRKGIGLGLSVVHQVATEHDGQVVVESAYGKGSRFRLVLPLEELDG